MADNCQFSIGLNIKHLKQHQCKYQAPKCLLLTLRMTELQIEDAQHIYCSTACCLRKRGMQGCVKACLAFQGGKTKPLRLFRGCSFIRKAAKSLCCHHVACLCFLLIMKSDKLSEVLHRLSFKKLALRLACSHHRRALKQGGAYFTFSAVPLRAGRPKANCPKADPRPLG